MVQTGKADLGGVPKDLKNYVVQKLAGGSEADPRAVELESTLNLVEEILGSKYLGQVTGAFNPLTYWTPGTNEQYVKNQVRQLKSLLALENRQKLKGQGTISDREFAVLTAASTAFDSNLSDVAAKREIEKVKTVLQSAKSRLTGSAQGGSQPPQQMKLPNGTVLTLQADGTYN